MTFKDIIKRDVQQTFLNVDEFSEIHTVNGKPMAVQIDNNEQIEREKRYSQPMDGTRLQGRQGNESRKAQKEPIQLSRSDSIVT